MLSARIRPRSWLVLAAAVGLACFSDEPDMTEPPEDGEVAAVVKMTPQVTFEPARVEIKVGQAVQWDNASNILHTVTADPTRANDPQSVRIPAGATAFNSGGVQTGASYTRTFTVPGEYRYFCIPHESAGMVGTVVVRE